MSLTHSQLPSTSKPTAKPYTTELHTALQAVHLASLLTKSHLLNHLSSTSTNVSASTKSDKSEVTVADFASQAVIISIIHAAFPDDVFIAEESGEMLRSDDELRGRVWGLLGTMGDIKGSFEVDETGGGTNGQVNVKLPETEEEMVRIIDLGQVGGRDSHSGSGRTWILDPIDGTKTYIRGQQYVVCLCLVEDGEQQVAVLGCPNLSIDKRDGEGRAVVEEGLVDLDGDGGWIVSCIKGKGVGMSKMREPFGVIGAGDVLRWNDSHNSTNGTTSTTKDEVDSEKADVHLRFTDSTASPHVSMDLHNRVFKHFSPASSPSSSAPLNIWSMQLKFVLLALRIAGADAMVRVPPQANYHASVWDHAGGQLLVRESGGVLTDANGMEFILGGKTRKLVENWGVVAVRGGSFSNGQESGGRNIHGAVLMKVRDEVDRR